MSVHQAPDFDWYVSGSYIYWNVPSGGGYYVRKLYNEPSHTSGWVNASSTSYLLSSIPAGGYCGYAVVFLDSSSDTAVSSDYTYGKRWSDSENAQVEFYKKCPACQVSYGQSIDRYEVSAYLTEDLGAGSSFWTTNVQYRKNGGTWSTITSDVLFSSLTDGDYLEFRSYTSKTSWQNSAYSSIVGFTHYKPTCDTPTAPILSADSTNVNIVYPYNSDYTTVSQYSVDMGTTWNTATSTTYPLSSLDNASGKMIYVRSKYTKSGFYDSAWATSHYQEPTCPSTGSIDISESADAAGIYITISSIPSGYRLWVEYQENGVGSWFPVQQSTTDYVTSNYFTGLSSVGIPSGTNIKVRAYLTKDHYIDGAPTVSNQITYIQGTCPVPNSLTATYNESTGNIEINVTADSGYFIQVVYDTGGISTSLTNGYSPINYNFDVSSIGNGVTVTIQAFCTKNYYNDSNWIGTSIYLNRKPSCNIFNFISGQLMTVQNIVKGTNGQYTADAIVMPASTWNSFTSKINEFRTYYSNKYGSIGQYAFTTIGSGIVFTASIYNEAKNAINGMFNTYEQLPDANSGVTEISANVLMNLQTKLNAVA